MVPQEPGNTTTMIFGVKHLGVLCVSRFMKLEPGDVITTGTPPGVALGRKPPNDLPRSATRSPAASRASARRPAGVVALEERGSSQ
jgi:2-keto-4-pentenoate hydratase/2-oxohepta-3-ene-1,7-dioic acid hydratase in catechol pathway